MAYASNTEVSVDRSRDQIEKLLHKHGARGFFYGSEGGRAMIGFRIMNDRGSLIAVRMELPLPDPDADDFTKTPTGKDRSRDQARGLWEQASRSRWRALLLIVKAKLEGIDLGITTIEREFMPDVLLKNGRTLGEVIAEQRDALEAGGGRLLLPGRSA